MFDLLDNIRNSSMPAENEGFNSKSRYLDLMEKSIAGYDFRDIEKRIDAPIFDFQNIFDSYSRIGMSRLLNVIAFLISNNRISGLYKFWISLMKSVLKDIAAPHDKSGVEFLVLEICTALITGRDFIKRDDYESCIESLAELDPYEKYDSTLKRKTPENLHNFCMYGICAEYLRGYLTGADTEDFILRHWKVQRIKFDTEGRYMDPGCPMVYDITSRYRLVLMLHLGYDGAAAGEMRKILSKSAPGLLYQMSSDYKFPFGGRSNQFNFNEALVASMCEYHASEFYAAGDIKVAGAFKHCAARSIEGLERWMNVLPARHIKNFYPIDSNYGIDSYGTYERYMGTMGTFLSGALMFCNENTGEYQSPNETGGYVYQTGNEFHKIFASCCGYSVEIDKKADAKYDATGLGRVHFTGAPSEIAISMPFSLHPKYLLGKYSNTKGRALGSFWYFNGNKEYLSESDCETETVILYETRESVGFILKYTVAGRGCVSEKYVINKAGISITAECDFGDISYCIPFFLSNGRDSGTISQENGSCSIVLGLWEYRVVWDGLLSAEFCDCLLYNRNGEYKELNIKNKKRQIKIKLSIKGADNEKIKRKT